MCVTTNGYMKEYDKDHPLSDKRGIVYSHRKILYDKIGAGPHKCHWCGRAVYWGLDPREDEDALVADHLDGDRLNNTASNLVPSCHPCNAHRHSHPTIEPLTYQGKPLTIRKAASMAGLPVMTLYNRLLRGWTIERALETPRQVRTQTQIQPVAA